MKSDDKIVAETALKILSTAIINGQSWILRPIRAEPINKGQDIEALFELIVTDSKTQAYISLFLSEEGLKELAAAILELRDKTTNAREAVKNYYDTGD